MAISDAQYTDWLQTHDKYRAILVEYVYIDSGTPGTGYAANTPFISKPTDTPANTPYDDVVSSNINYRRRMSEVFTGRSSVSKGEVALTFNEDNAPILDYYFDTQPLNLYLGDPSWDRDDFRKIVSGTTKNRSITQNAVTLKFRDESELLNTPFVRTYITSGIADGAIIPLCFGDCVNVTPLLIDPSLDMYQVHDGPINSVLQVRDNGVIVGFTQDITTGKFTLDVPAVGRVTCDVQGAAPTSGVITGYKSTAVDIMELILTNYVGISTSVIDSASLNTLDSAAPYNCGLYIANDGYLFISAVDALLRSISAYWLFDRLGIFKVGRLVAPSSGGEALLPDEIEEFGVSIKKEIPPQTSITLGYAKNWTNQANGLADSLAVSARDTYSKSHSSSTDEDAAAILALYPNAKAGVERVTLLRNIADANAETARLMTLVNVPRTIYSVKATSSSFGFNLGDDISLEYNGFGFTSGQDVVVVGIDENIGNNFSTLEVWL